ncbi:MAG: hypothetical protein K0S91_857 [Nitrososphaeraceae archaeon]|nr:hypothetical protein [Nitrososphaeraceae archaeon]
MVKDYNTSMGFSICSLWRKHTDVNNQKSKVAYLMGSFFLIHKTVLEGVGAFQSVSKAV